MRIWSFWPNFCPFLEYFSHLCRGIEAGLGLDYFTSESILLALPQKLPKEPIPESTIPRIGPKLVCMAQSSQI
jgi:hypothetical protein